MSAGTGSSRTPVIDAGPEGGLDVNRPGGGQGGWLRALESPVANYYLILGCTLALTGLGLIMVLSSSSVESYAGGKGSSFSLFYKQAFCAVLGLPLMFLASRIRLGAWKRLAWVLIALAVVLQFLVFLPGLGHDVNGNNSWIEIGGFTAQPSEAGKLALVLWLGVVLGAKRKLLSQWKHVAIPVLPVVALMLLVILASGDLGTSLIFMILVLVALYAAGVPLRMFGVAGVGLAILTAVLVFSNSNRMGRIFSLFSGGPCDGGNLLQKSAENWQPAHGCYALASGGWWGVGLGASREKWQYLPEAHNDFIYAIIGEELGLPGTIGVIVLFAILAIALVRVIKNATDLTVKITTSAVFAWIIGQTIINLGVVLGLLPVIGLPLPLISYGGSSLITTLVAIGIVLSFARSEAGAKAVMAEQAHQVRRSLAVLGRRTPERPAMANRRR